MSDGAREPPSGWHRHAASSTCLPKGSASWKLNDERVYGPDDESVSLLNEDIGTLVTLYTYPARDAFDVEFQEVVAEISHTCTENPVMTSEQGGTHFVACVRRMDGVLLVEQALMFQRDKWLHKARITFPDVASQQAYTPVMSVVSQAFAPCPR